MAFLSIAEKKLALTADSELDPQIVSHHFECLDTDYFNLFEVEAIRAHLQALGRMAIRPFELQFASLGERVGSLTLIGRDYDGLFFALTGVIASLGYDIRSGFAFSCNADGLVKTTQQNAVIDYLILEHPLNNCSDEFAQQELQHELELIYEYLEKGNTAGLRSDLFRRMGEFLEQRQTLNSEYGALETRIEQHLQGTALVVQGQDRQAMLFCLSSALNLQGISIVKVIASAERDRFEDRFILRARNGKPITDNNLLLRIKVAVLLTGRYLGVLPVAADFRAALEGLHGVITSWLEESLALVEGPDPDLTFLPALVRVLSAGPHLADAVLKMGLSGFRQLIDELQIEKSVSNPTPYRHEFERLCNPRLGTVENSDPDPSWQKLRDYRDRERLKAELNFLLNPESNLDALAQSLTDLAEAALNSFFKKIVFDLTLAHGNPCPYALMALGKFGGNELGSGSDLEILCVFSEPGETIHPESPLRYGAFFQKACELLKRYWAISDGQIFALDFRLRPHGESGPLGVAFPLWKSYLKPGGEAFDYERQALLRLRAFCGDPHLIAAIHSERDQILFGSQPIGIQHTQQLHLTQIATKTTPAKINAKYSQGCMVEVEYAVQFLQLRNGAHHPLIRQGHTGKGLEALLAAGIISLGEFEHLYIGYLFLRRLISAMRLTRGRAHDLEIPDKESLEFAQLARRMGYTLKPNRKPEQQLHWDLKQTRLAVGGYYRHQFEGQPKPEILYQSLAQNLMDPDTPFEEVIPVLERLGLTTGQNARKLFLQLFDTVLEKRLLAAVLLMGEDRIARCADPDHVLKQWLTLFQSLPHPDVLVMQMLHYPRILDIMLLCMSQSQFLTETLLHDPELLKQFAEPEALSQPRALAELRRLAALAMNRSDWGESLEERLCRWRNHEYLRIALRDLLLGVHIQKVTLEISNLSDTLIQCIFQAGLEKHSCQYLAKAVVVMGMGKLGGNELNYSSDIDLIFVADETKTTTDERTVLERVGQFMISHLSRSTGAGQLFRVDMNLRPWGGQGQLLGTYGNFVHYYSSEAHGWELQAWLKARPIAGDTEGGSRLVQKIQAISTLPANWGKVVESMRKVRLMGLDKLKKEQLLAGEVKLGPGGIRTVEFFIQSLQIKNAQQHPDLITGNTLEAMGRLLRNHLLSPSQYDFLASAYVFLRRVEHALQLWGLQQRHTLPSGATELESLARRLGFENKLGQTAKAQFLDRYRKHMLTLQGLSGELFDY